MSRQTWKNEETRQFGKGQIKREVKPRGDVWKATIYIGLKPDGKRQDRPTKSFPSLQAAQDWINDMAVDSRQGKLISRDIRVSKLLDEYLEDRTGRVSERTLREYREVNKKFAAITPFSAVDLKNLTAEKVNYALRKIAEESSPKYANRSLDQLRRIMLFARRRKYIYEDVSRDVEKLSSEKRIKVGEGEDIEFDPRSIWEPEEVHQFLSTARDHRMYALYELKLSYGFRIGELMALRWDSIDFTKSGIHIKGSYDSRSKTVGKPKRESGRRVRITPHIAEILREHKARQALEKAAAGEMWEENGILFPTGRGKYNEHTNIREMTDRLIKLAGVKRIRLHDFRHTAASAMIRAGYDVAHVAAILGHKNPALTWKVYVHVFESTRQKNVGDTLTLYPVTTPDALPLLPVTVAVPKLMN